MNAQNLLHLFRLHKRILNTDIDPDLIDRGLLPDGRVPRREDTFILILILNSLFSYAFFDEQGLRDIYQV